MKPHEVAVAPEAEQAIMYALWAPKSAKREEAVSRSAVEVSLLQLRGAVSPQRIFDVVLP
jgi:hypothetical protein